MAQAPIEIKAAHSRRDIKTFHDVGLRMNADDPNYVRPLLGDTLETFNPRKNPFYAHARVQPMIAWRDGKPVGRISAHIDELALTQPPQQGMGPGTGSFGFLDAADAEVAAALIAAAEQWLRGEGMTRVIGPLSLSIWDMPGVLTYGHDHSPTIMMGHDGPEKRQWIEDNGYHAVKELRTYELDITKPFSPLIQRIVNSGHKSSRIRVRQVQKSKFDEEVAIIVDILNDAWSSNWGFVPFTNAEIAYTAKKLRPIVHEELIMIAEVDGQPKAFMITMPDFNEVLKPLKGKLFPFGWFKLLKWLRRPSARTIRVPLMGVRKELQSSRMASQLAFMLIEAIRANSVEKFGATRGEIGWILDDNQGMVAIADAIESDINRIYTIYEKPL